MGGYLCLCVTLFLVVSVVTGSSLVRNVLCYNVFMVAGYVFYRNLRRIYVCLIGLAASALLLAYHFFQIPFCPMQGHKFPPDLLFLTYGVFVLAVLSVLFSKVTLPNWHILRLWNKHGFNIYLFQNVPYTLVALSIRHGGFPSSPWVQMFMSIAVIFGISTAMAWVFERMKRNLGFDVT